ncbi:hypothetical protein Mapa_002572 [Marchantia paleacea]|nr:hypothetical protein Mapa_002572 [Marchantia paleacea]
MGSSYGITTYIVTGKAMKNRTEAWHSILLKGSTKSMDNIHRLPNAENCMRVAEKGSRQSQYMGVNANVRDRNRTWLKQ